MNRVSVREMWEAFRAGCIPTDASAAQVKDMRMAFYTGAYDVFNAIVESLEPGEEPTEADLSLMDDLNRELNAGIAEFIQPQGPQS